MTFTTNIRIICVFMFFCGFCRPGKAADVSADDHNLVWQLGINDGKSDEFIEYSAWEYARNSWLKGNPNYNAGANTFSYAISRLGIHAKPSCPGGVSAEYYKYWMPEDEVITGLEINWNEEESGLRKLEIHTAGYFDRNGLGNDIRVVLPEGKIAYFQMPRTPGRTRSKHDLDWQVVFNVKPGANRLIIKDVMLSRENRVDFDCIKLYKTGEDIPLLPVIEASTDKTGNIFFPDDNAVLRVNLFNLNADSGKLRHRIYNYDQDLIKEVTIKASDKLSINLPAAVKGYFEVHMDILDQQGKPQNLGMADSKCVVRYAVTDPPQKDKIADVVTI